MPFAAAGFAAVVALVPGLFAFRAVSSLIELISVSADAKADLVQIFASDLTTFSATVVMVTGLLVPCGNAVLRFRPRAVHACEQRLIRGGIFPHILFDVEHRPHLRASAMSW
jgi:uncharacterized membrane protein YjjB (DUF3815 family)